MSYTWQGWMNLGSPAEDSGAGAWVDLTRPFNGETASVGLFALPVGGLRSVRMLG